MPKISLGSLWGSVKLCSPSKPIVRPQRFPSTAQMLRTHSKLTKVLITKLVLIKNLSLFMTLQHDSAYGLLVCILFEDANGEFWPDELANITKLIRHTMVANGWQGGHSLTHIHKNYHPAEACMQECLANGCSGIWSGVNEEVEQPEQLKAY